MRQLLLALILLLVAVAAASATSTPDADAPVRKVAWVWIELDATGAVTDVVQDEGQNALIAGVLDAHARRLAFAPAQADGAAVASGFALQLTVDFVPVGDGGFRPDLLLAKIVPARNVLVRPPRYPPAAAIAGIGGFVRVALTVGGEGQVDAASIAVTDSDFFGDHVSERNRQREAFHAATTAAAAAWRFRNARIGATPVTVRISMPTTFHPPDRRSGAPLPAGLEQRAADSVPAEVVDAGRQMPRLLTTFAELPPVPGIEIRSSRVRRGGSP